MQISSLPLCSPPVADGDEEGGQIRVVIDRQVVEIFTGCTPFSFQYEPLGGGRAVELVGPGKFTAKASHVRPAVVNA